MAESKDKKNTSIEIIEPGEPVKDSSSGTAISPSDPVAQYLAEVRRYPVLTREQELQVAEKYYETRDPIYAQQLVQANLRFVVKVALEYSKFGAKLIDLIQEGNLGLMQAVKDYNPHKGVKLISYAVWWIRGHIQDYLMKQYSMVKIGTTQNQRKLFYQIQKHKKDLEQLGYHDGVKLLSGKLDIPENEVESMTQRMNFRDLSLDQPLTADGDSSSFLDLQSDDEIIDISDDLADREELQNLKDKIDELMPTLKEKEIFMLHNRLLADKPMTLQEIGDKYGTTREAVRQAEVRLVKKITKFIKPD